MTDRFLCTLISLRKGPKVGVNCESCQMEATRKVKKEIAWVITPVISAS